MNAPGHYARPVGPLQQSVVPIRAASKTVSPNKQMPGQPKLIARPMSLAVFYVLLACRYNSPVHKFTHFT